MGCQCNKKQEDEKEDELLKKNDMEFLNDNEDNKDSGANKNNTYDSNKGDNMGNNRDNGNREDNESIERITEEKNAKYGDYPEKILEIINKIREDPASYAEVIEDSIKNIIEEPDKDNEYKTKKVFKKKVKVALTRGEPAFREAADILRNTEPLPPLELNSDICIPLPETVVEIKDPAFLKEQVKTLRESMTIDIFFKDLIKLPEVSALLMIVDDSVKNPGRKRNALLNRDFKYVGINSHFIGKNFVAYFAFSK